MKNKSGLLILLLLSSSGFAQQNDGHTPMATTAEATGSFRDIPYLKKAFIDTAPTDRKDGILVGELGVDSGNKGMIVKLAQEIADSQHDNFDSLLIAHKGKLLFESYYLRGRSNLPHPQASATKVYTSLALGRAIQLGYLTMADLDKPLVGFLQDLNPTKFVEGAEKITLHHAMNMRSGIRISEEQRADFEKTPGQLKGQGQVQTYLEHSAPITSASQSFLYQNDPMLVMQVLDAVVPGTAKDFIKRELLDVMGITNYRWLTDVSGLPRGGSGSSMTSRDMVKWGILAMNKGKWNGEQLVPEAFIAKATNRIIYTGDDDVYGGGKDVFNQGYGYYWWSADMKYDNDSYFSVSAQGGGGQYIILIEALDLLVVVTAHDNDNSTLQVTAERILPAFIQNAVSDVSDKSVGTERFSVPEIPYTIAYTSRKTGDVELYLSDRKGQSNLKSTHVKGGYMAWSPDGKQFAFYAKYDERKTWSIHTMNVDGTNRRRLTHAKHKWDSAPAWSPDGKKIAFARTHKDSQGIWHPEIWIMNSDGSEQTQIKSLQGSNPYFTADSKIVFSLQLKDSNSELAIADIDGSNVIQLTENEANEWHPDVSPDGRQIAFMSDRDGNYEIYVMNIDGSDQKRLTNNEVDDWYPSWSPDGSKIMFSSIKDYEKEKHIYMMNKDGTSVTKMIPDSGYAVFKR